MSNSNKFYRTCAIVHKNPKVMQASRHIKRSHYREKTLKKQLNKKMAYIYNEETFYVNKPDLNWTLRRESFFLHSINLGDVYGETFE